MKNSLQKTEILLLIARAFIVIPIFILVMLCTLLGYIIAWVLFPFYLIFRKPKHLK